MNIAKNIITIAQDVPLNQSRAIENPVNFPYSIFGEFVKSINSLKGCFVITGIGKSAFYANKILTMINLTIAPSVFICAANIIHWDSGVIPPKDTVISISKSGNTTEFVALVPLLKRSGTKLVALRPSIMCNQF